MGRDRLDTLDYYTLLGVNPGATEAEIRRAFRLFARRYHPDRHAHETPDKRTRATQIYRRGSEGIQVLLDPAARRLYDDQRSRGLLRLTADQRDGASRPVAPKRRDTKTLIRSPQALGFYQSAAGAARRKDYMTALRLLQKAEHLEPGNPLIRSRIAKVESIIRRMR